MFIEPVTEIPQNEPANQRGHQLNPMRVHSSHAEESFSKNGNVGAYPASREDTGYKINKDGVHPDDIDDEQPGWFPTAYVDQVIEHRQNEQAPTSTHINKRTGTDAFDNGYA